MTHTRTRARGATLRIGSATIVLLLCLAAGLRAASSTQRDGRSAAPVDPVDPQAVEVVRRAWEFLGAVEQFTARAELWYDVALDDDETIQYEATVALSVRRPDRLRIAVRGDVEDRELWYDGAAISVFDSGFYASTKARATIDETLDLAVATYDLRFPLQELALAAPRRKEAESVLSATYLGIHTAGGVACHHVLWSEIDVDVQVWIDAGEQPLPRRIVVEHKDSALALRVQSTLVAWDLDAELADEVFVFTPPEDALEIEIVESEAPK